MSIAHRIAPRTMLFLPASNSRAIAKARLLLPDMVVLDLEDAVKADAKVEARAMAVAAAGEGFGDRLCAIRINGADAPEHRDDAAAVACSAADVLVCPKVESPEAALRLVDLGGKPILAMIETPLGVLAAANIAAVPGVVGLVAGVNDLRVGLGIPGTGREGLTLALQMIVLAARASNGWAIDGVFNALDDAQGLAAECRQGRMFGFDGKSLIHPNQIQAAASAFGPAPEEIEDAEALIAAAKGGAERFRGRMIEAMHVDQARILLERAEMRR